MTASSIAARDPSSRKTPKAPTTLLPLEWVQVAADAGEETTKQTAAKDLTLEHSSLTRMRMSADVDQWIESAMQPKYHQRMELVVVDVGVTVAAAFAAESTFE